MATNEMAATPNAPDRRRAAGLARPIASSLGLDAAHVGVIEQSHDRCAALGLSRIERPDYAPLGRPDLAVVRERNRRLHSHAAPVMEMLSEQIVGTESMVVLCDSAGTVIHSIGDDDFLLRASQVALQPGVNWSEQAKGTNAIGTALMDELPTLVHADEHFMHANHFLTCSAAPILDPRGNVLGVLDVTGDHRSYHPHTMALVKMSVRMIENHWLSDDHRNAMRLHFHQRPEFIDTLMEGILAISPEGRVVGANRSALEQLGCNGAALRMQNLASLFGTPVGLLVDRFRSPLATPMAVQTALGRHFHIHARVNWSAWGSVPALPVSPVTPVSPVPRIAPAAASSAGLSQLLTGDARVAALVAKLQRVLDHDVPIVVTGETGTGKEVLARAIHQDSARAQKPFVAVRCAGLADDTDEASRSGADNLLDQAQQAHGGTLFLDDVHDLPPALQARLLRNLQQGWLTHHGHGPAVLLDLALVCSSTLPLRATTLRPDLQHRLNGLCVHLPPLRERSDLPALVQRMLGRPVGPEVLALLQAQAWPGNLRELHNLLRTAALLAGPGAAIQAEHLPDDWQTVTPPAPGPADQSLQALELQALRAAVDAAGGNIALAARRLGVGRNTIYRKLRWGPAAAGR